MRQQRTLATEVTIQGTAIHQGGDTVIRLKPSESDSGIVFVTQSGETIQLMVTVPLAVSSHMAPQIKATKTTKATTQ